MTFELRIGLLLVSAAPTFAMHVAGVRRLAVRAGLHNELHLAAVAVLVALDVVAFGLPPWRPSPAWVLGGALLLGVTYHLVEWGRVRLTHRDAVRVGPRVAALGLASARTLLVLLAAAAGEEVLFRWYLVHTPVAAGLLSVPAAVALSSLAFALAHLHFGLGVAVSRGLFGAVLAFVVVVTGDVLAAVVAHAAYNGLVHAHPVVYARPARGSIR